MAANDPSSERWESFKPVRGAHEGWFSRSIAFALKVGIGAVLFGLIAAMLPHLTSPSAIKDVVLDLVTLDNSSSVVSRFLLGAAIGVVVVAAWLILRRGYRKV